MNCTRNGYTYHQKLSVGAARPFHFDKASLWYARASALHLEGHKERLCGFFQSWNRDRLTRAKKAAPAAPAAGQGTQKVGLLIDIGHPNITTTSSAHCQPIIKIICQTLINNQISGCKPINKH